MYKGIITVLIMASLLPIAAFGHEEADERIHAFAQEAISGGTIDCGALLQEDIIALGDELMELMMGGELHEAMDERLGSSEDSMHLMMGRMMGCGDDYGMGKNMMNMMMSNARFGGGMMGMMGFGGYGSGMMGSFGWGFMGLLWWIIAIGLVVLVWLWVIKLWKEVTGRKKR